MKLLQLIYPNVTELKGLGDHLPTLIGTFGDSYVNVHGVIAILSPMPVEQLLGVRYSKYLFSINP
jgi:hypothetical protein